MPGPIRPVRTQQSVPPRTLFWPNTKSLIERKAITPIISSFMSASLAGGDMGDLAKRWAGAQPILTDSECRDLARVAQYHSVQGGHAVSVYVEFLNQIRQILYDTAINDSELDEQVRVELLDNWEEIEQLSPSEFAYRLGYPRFADLERNPLRLLADLQLPLFITTCHHDFLEHALRSSGGNVEPVSEIFYWNDALESFESIYDTEPDYKPSAQRPLVYHLFGRDAIPESLVLTEDDHLDWLVRLSELRGQVNTSNPQALARSLPTVVRNALSSHGLLLLGYNIDSWDFRVLFRGLIVVLGSNRVGNTKLPRGICMQMDPSAKYGAASQDVKEHFQKYFNTSAFDVYWGDELHCVRTLRDLWKGGS